MSEGAGTQLRAGWRAEQWGGARTESASQSLLTSALYMRMRPWFTLDQEGTALMFHSWLECSANGPVFIWKRRVHKLKRWALEPTPCSPPTRLLQHTRVHTHM